MRSNPGKIEVKSSHHRREI